MSHSGGRTEGKKNTDEYRDSFEGRTLRSRQVGKSNNDRCYENQGPDQFCGGFRPVWIESADPDLLISDLPKEIFVHLDQIRGNQTDERQQDEIWGIGNQAFAEAGKLRKEPVRNLVRRIFRRGEKTEHYSSVGL